MCGIISDKFMAYAIYVSHTYVIIKVGQILIFNRKLFFTVLLVSPQHVTVHIPFKLRIV